MGGRFSGPLVGAAMSPSVERLASFMFDGTSLGFRLPSLLALYVHKSEFLTHLQHVKVSNDMVEILTVML